MVQKIKDAIVIDDDPISNYVTTKVLQLSCISNDVLSFSSAREALAHIKRQKEKLHCFPELLIVDINMPIMNGFQFLEQLTGLFTADEKGPIVIGLSAERIPSFHLKKVSFHHTLMKPFCQEDCEQILENYFKHLLTA